MLFDEALNEFHIFYQGKGRVGAIVVCCCPSCGGPAPPSRRGDDYQEMKEEELARLRPKNETFVWCGTRTCEKRASNGATLLRRHPHPERLRA